MISSWHTSILLWLHDIMYTSVQVFHKGKKKKQDKIQVIYNALCLPDFLIHTASAPFTNVRWLTTVAQVIPYQIGLLSYRDRSHNTITARISSPSTSVVQVSTRQLTVEVPKEFQAHSIFMRALVLTWFDLLHHRGESGHWLSLLESGCTRLGTGRCGRAREG